MMRLESYAIDPIKLKHYIRGAEVNGKQAKNVDVLQGLKHNVRNGTEEGLNERGTAFPCILSTLLSLYPNHKGIGDAPIKVLISVLGLDTWDITLPFLKAIQPPRWY